MCQSFATLAWACCLHHWRWRVTTCPNCVCAHCITKFKSSVYLACFHCSAWVHKAAAWLHWFAISCYFFYACMQSSIYIQCAWGACNHHRGISTLVLLIVWSSKKYYSVVATVAVKYSASSFKRPLEVITLLYLAKLVKKLAVIHTSGIKHCRYKTTGIILAVGVNSIASYLLISECT